MTIPSVSVAQVHNAIVTQLSGLLTQFGIVYVQDYPRQVDKLEVPAVLLDVEQMDVLNDPGTEQTRMSLRFSAVVVVGSLRNDAAGLDPRMSVRVLAMAVAHAINRQRWGIDGCGPAKVQQVQPDAFDPRLDRFECWRIEWTHEVMVGDDIWNQVGMLPTQVWSADTPEGFTLDPQKIVYPMPAP